MSSWFWFAGSVDPVSEAAMQTLTKRSNYSHAPYFYCANSVVTANILTVKQSSYIAVELLECKT